MPLPDILTTAQDFLLGTGETITLEASVPDMVATLARLCPVFGNVLLLANRWVVGHYGALTQTVMDLTPQAQGPGDVPLGTTAPGDALLIGAGGAFDRVVFTLTTPATGVPTYQWSYWNGWQWAVLTPRLQPLFSATGTQTLTFEIPGDWTPGVPPGMTFPPSLDPVQFWLRLTTPTPPTTVAVASTLDVTQRFFPLPERVLQLLALHFFPRELEPMGVSWAQDTLDPAWRNRTGTPNRYTQELETTRRVRLHPSPTAQGTVGGLPPFQGLPGAMVPTNHLVAFFLEAPDVVDLAPWAEDFVAYLLAAWESLREGIQHDPPMAQALYALVGLLVPLCKELASTPGEELVKGAWEMPLWPDLTAT